MFEIHVVDIFLQSVSGLGLRHLAHGYQRKISSLCHINPSPALHPVTCIIEAEGMKSAIV